MTMNVSFLELIDLASEALGGKALETNDDFFAEMQNLLKVGEAVFIPGKYTENGKWMDGWESRRKRGLGPGNDHDWCIVQLGLPGIVRGLSIDTAHFTGNFPEYAAVDAIFSQTRPGAGAAWKEILPKSRLQGGTKNLFPISENGPVTHLRLRIFPDGGVARLRVHGEVVARIQKGAAVDLASVTLGGTVVAANDMYFGNKDNLIMPGRATTMGEGWETRRKRGPGHDWIVVKLAAAGKVSKIEVDTNHYKGNFPDSASLEGLSYPKRDLVGSDVRDRKDLAWKEIVPQTKLKAHHQHFFDVRSDEAFDYIRLNIFPDGGISRLRVIADPA
jgi:allantoicase